MHLDPRGFWRTFACVVVFCGAVSAVAADPPGGRQALADEQHIRRLIGQLASPIFAAREEAGKKLVAVGPPALEALQRAASAADGEVARRAAACIQAIAANERLAAWVVKLSDQDPRERARAADEIQNFGPGAGGAVPALTRALCDRDKRVCRRAVAALSYLGREAQPAVPTLLRILNDRKADEELRWAVAMDLGAITTNAPGAVPALLDMLDHGSPLLRHGAAFGLAALGRRDARTIPALLKALRANHGTVQAAIARALGTLGAEPAAVVPALVRALKEASAGSTRDNDYATEGILLGLRGFGSEATPAIPAIVVIIREPHRSDRQRQRAIRALEGIGPPAGEAVPLLKALAREGGNLASDAESALRSIEGQRRWQGRREGVPPARQ